MAPDRTGGHRPPLHPSRAIFVGAACGRPPLPYGTCWRAGSFAPHTKKNHAPLPRHSEAVRRSNPYLPSLAPSPRELSPQATEGVFLSRTKTGDADSSLSLRPRKVRFASFPPDGENALRSLARPLTTRPTLLGSCCVKDGGYGFFAVASSSQSPLCFVSA